MLIMLLVLLATITFLDRLAIAVAGPRIQAELGLSPQHWDWVLGWSAFPALTGAASRFVPLVLTRFLFGAGEAGAGSAAAGRGARTHLGRQSCGRCVVAAAGGAESRLRPADDILRAGRSREAAPWEPCCAPASCGSSWRCTGATVGFVVLLLLAAHVAREGTRLHRARDGGWWGRSAVGSTFLAATAALLVADALMRDRGLAVVLISLGFGVSDLMLPSAWASCLDVAGQHADAVAGVPDTAGQGGGFLCTVVFGYPVGWSGDYDLPVYAIAAIVALSANLFTRIDASRPLIENAS